MGASVYSTGYLAGLFGTGEVGRLFADSTELQAMLLVEGTLAEVQGALGVIPEAAAAAIRRTGLEMQIDPQALADGTASNAVVIPSLVAALRAALPDPDHAQYVHWGATSQDIIDTALMLRLRQALSLLEADLCRVLTGLGDLAETHAETPMPARTWGQIATPTSFGGIVAEWGAPLLDLRAALPDLSDQSLWVSLSGAAGTGAALGPQAAQIRAALAKRLGLHDPGRSWHSDRGPILRIAGWCGQVTAALAHMGQSLTALRNTTPPEITLASAGGSSTMPQKQNPVAPARLVALHNDQTATLAALHQSAVHSHQRDGAAWMGEWMALPRLILNTAQALSTARALEITPDEKAMRAHLEEDGGLAYAEALSFALAQTMPRADAQAEVKRLSQLTRDNSTTLREAAQAAHPGLPETLFDPQSQMGTAPDDARAFAARCRDLP